MSYETAREALATVLEGIEGIERVYREEPDTLEDIPCFVMYGSSGYAEYTFGGMALPDSQETETVFMILKDADSTDGQTQIRVFHKRLIDALRTEGGLDNQGAIARIEWDRQLFYVFSGKTNPAQVYRITMIIIDP